MCKRFNIVVKSSSTKMDFKSRVWIFFFLLFIQGVFADRGTSDHTVPCKNGWFYFNGMCYKLFKDKLTWDESQSVCSTEGGNLTTIDSKGLQDFLTTFLLLGSQSSPWIGLRRGQVNFTEHEASYVYYLKHKEAYVWTDGSPSKYRNWDSEMPRPKSENDSVEIYCVNMLFSFYKHKLGLWEHGNCDQKRPFICQSVKDEYNTAPDPRYCSDNGFKFLDNCYHVVESKKSWYDAEKFCKENFKAHLVTILYSVEEHFVDFLLSGYDDAFWIGVRGSEENTAKWLSCKPIIYRRLRWEYFPSYQCAVLSAGKYEWEETRCSKEHPFICMKRKEDSFLTKNLCPSTSKSWIDFGGDTCYLLDTEKLHTWQKAKEDCEEQGGNLITVRSEFDTFALYSLTSTYLHISFYIGLHRSLQNKSAFVWDDGTELLYENWATGEPDMRNGDCVTMTNFKMEWDVSRCNKQQRYVCTAKKAMDSNDSYANYDKQCAEITSSDKSGYDASKVMMVILTCFVIAMLY